MKRRIKKRLKAMMYVDLNNMKVQKPEIIRAKWTVEKCLKMSIIWFLFGIYLLVLSLLLQSHTSNKANLCQYICSFESSFFIALSLVRFPFISDETKKRILFNVKPVVGIVLVGVGFTFVVLLFNYQYNDKLYISALFLISIAIYIGISLLVLWFIDLYKTMNVYFKSKNITINKLSKMFSFIGAIVGVLTGIMSLIVTLSGVSQ